MTAEFPIGKLKTSIASDLRTIVVADVGGTHARFALATIGGGKFVALAEPLTLKTGNYASFQTAWEQFDKYVGAPLPDELAIAFAGPVDTDFVKLTNSPWVIHPEQIADKLQIKRFLILNDFGAVAHAVANLNPSAFVHLCGDEGPLPETGVITVVGPGTGFGVAVLLKRADGYEVIETEGGHVDFAPLDSIEDQLLSFLRKTLRRVSIERLVAGGGLVNIHAALGAIEQRSLPPLQDKDLWAVALAQTDSLATAALDRFCLILGAVAGDLALAHGAHAVVIAGDLARRLQHHLPQSGFAGRFIAKGRFERRMQALPVKLANHDQLGLVGAAAAFASKFS
jgi:glucokinase